jgi:hypothetical protein
VTVGSGLVQHQLGTRSATPGHFDPVIELVGFLFLLAQTALHAAEPETQVVRRLRPRRMKSDGSTKADHMTPEDARDLRDRRTRLSRCAGPVASLAKAFPRGHVAMGQARPLPRARVMRQPVRHTSHLRSGSDRELAKLRNSGARDPV